jgi:serine-type D-Ala-D-Ala carboxypeptidase/endopeptidase (penicillin-binding protein 4)
VGALSTNFNSVEVHMAASGTAGMPVRVRVFPPQAGITIRNVARTVAAGESRRGVAARTEARLEGTAVVVEGEMAVGADARVAYRKLWETTSGFGRTLAALFDECGIRVGGVMREGRVPDSIAGREPFCRFESLPLASYVGYLFKYSNNITAEMLLRTMGAERKGVGSWDSGAAVIREWWREQNLPGELRLVNGSGMGSANRLSAAQVVALLEYAHSRKHYFPDYLAALSNAGIDGTLADRFKRSPLKGLVRAKTGTLNSQGVSSLAGYAFKGDSLWVFAIMVNDKTHGQFDHWVLQEKLLESVLLN